MGQNKSNKAKESSREKKLRKKEYAVIKRQVYTIVLPAVAAIFLCIIAYVYLKTRTKNFDE